MLSITHNAGFFSCCNVKLHKIINYFNNNKQLPDIIDSSRQFAMYKPFQMINKDITYHFFKSYSSSEMNTIIPFIKPIVITPDEREDQFSNYKLLNINEIKPFIEKYFYPSEFILYIKKILLEKYSINTNNCIAVYYRGTDKYRETKLGDFKSYLDKINELMNKNNANNKNNEKKQLLIQTDSSDFLQYIKNNYGNNIAIDVIVINENKVSVENIGIHHENNSEINFNDINHLFATFLIMSECNHLIVSSGNCSLWMMYYRCHTNNVHQYLYPGFI